MVYVNINNFVLIFIKKLYFLVFIKFLINNFNDKEMPMENSTETINVDEKLYQD